MFDQGEGEAGLFLLTRYLVSPDEPGQRVPPTDSPRCPPKSGFLVLFVRFGHHRGEALVHFRAVCLPSLVYLMSEVV